MGKERVILKDHTHAPVFGFDPVSAIGDDAPVNDDRPIMGALESRYEPQERGLARPRRPKHCHKLALAHGERERPELELPPYSEGDIMQLDKLSRHDGSRAGRPPARDRAWAAIRV